MKKTILSTLLFAIGTVAFANNTLAPITDCTTTLKLPKGYQVANADEDCDFNENMIPVSHAGEVGYANRAGKIVIKPRFEEAYGFDEQLALVKHKGKYGYINPKGNFVIKPTFDDAWSFKEGRAKITQNGKFGFIDKTGKIVIKPILDDADNWFSHNMVAVKRGGQWGFIDNQGRTKVPFEYDYVSSFNEGLALVAKRTNPNSSTYRFGFIDTYGTVVIPLSYDQATSFIDGVATVTKDNQIFYINKQGKRLTTPQHTRFL